MTTLRDLRRSLWQARQRAAAYRSAVGPCPRWDMELDALAEALGAKPVTRDRFALLDSPVRTSRAGSPK